MKQYLKLKNRYYTRRFLPNVALIAVLGMTGLFMNCRNNHDMNTPNKPIDNSTGKTHTVTFNVDGTNSTLKATIDGKDMNTSPIEVESGKIVSFTASPNHGFMVHEWTITGGSFETGSGKQGNTTAKLIVKAPVRVTVSFKNTSPTPPPPRNHYHL